MFKHARLRIGLILALAWTATPAGAADLAALKASFRRPATIFFPADNPFTADKAALGKALFFDPRVSGGGNITCHSCHNPSFGWSDGQAKALGALAKPLPRHSPSILNVAWGESFFWDGRAASLEQQALGPITAPAEMNMPMDMLVRRLRAIDGYRHWFDRVFPGQGVTERTVPQAIATFERIIVSERSPFDAWIEGDESALPEAAKRGFILFTGKADCAACHMGWAFTDHRYHDIGLPDQDMGRAAIAPDEPRAQHAFKTPGLRNIRQRAPYMHDGGLDSLEAVIAHYMGGGIDRPSRSPQLHPLDLTDSEKQDLTAFLDALTSSDAPMALPVLPK